MSETHSVTTKLVIMLTIHILIEGRDILPEVFQNNDIAKRVLIGVTHIQSRSGHALNETMFLVTYPLGILAEDVSSAIKKSMNGLVSL